jgi:SAM-dependent methyltransferase
MPAPLPYQLQMFDKSLKKRQKVELLLRHLGDVTGRRCLLVTCGDNNGAMNYKFREHGGAWTWADAQPDLKAEMERLLGEPVHAVQPQRLPFPDAAFDTVVAIDVHEHLKDPTPFTAELKRVVRPGGTVIVTVPNGNSRKLACRIKSLLGMTPEIYGHERWGYDIEELSGMLSDSGLKPVASSSYARFFTEMVELAINFLYVKVLKRGGTTGGGDHAIAPGTEDDLRKVQKSFRIYAMAYPVLKAVSLLDLLVFFTRGYAVVVEAAAPAANASAPGRA